MTVSQVQVLAEQIAQGDIITQSFTDVQEGRTVPGQRTVVIRTVEGMTLRTRDGDKELTRITGLDAGKGKKVIFALVPDQVLTVTRTS